jgi:hypothetical protein
MTRYCCGILAKKSSTRFRSLRGGFYVTVRRYFLAQDLCGIDKQTVTDWGFATLVPTSSRQPDPVQHRETLYHCAQSEPLLLNSLTYQITLDPRHAQYADEYYGRSIALFRKTLLDTKVFHDDLAPLAGIMLCSISVRRRPL